MKAGVKTGLTKRVRDRGDVPSHFIRPKMSGVHEMAALRLFLRIRQEAGLEMKNPGKPGFFHW